MVVAVVVVITLIMVTVKVAVTTILVAVVAVIVVVVVVLAVVLVVAVVVQLSMHSTTKDIIKTAAATRAIPATFNNIQQECQRNNSDKENKWTHLLWCNISAPSSFGVLKARVHSNIWS